MNDVLEQLNKIESNTVKARLEFLLMRKDLNKKTRKLLEKYIETLTEIEEYFHERIRKSL